MTINGHEDAQRTAAWIAAGFPLEPNTGCTKTAVNDPKVRWEMRRLWIGWNESWVVSCAHRRQVIRRSYSNSHNRFVSRASPRWLWFNHLRPGRPPPRFVVIIAVTHLRNLGSRLIFGRRLPTALQLLLVDSA